MPPAAKHSSSYLHMVVRYQVRFTILTSRQPVSRWHEQVGDPTVADGILDRLVHNAHCIERRGDSMRKNAKRRTREPGAAFSLNPLADQAPSLAQQRRQGGEVRLRQTRGIFHGDQDGS
jgi:hypothetical protein